MQSVSIPPCQNPKVPAPQAPFHHVVDIQTRFTDIDVLGHVNNGAYFSYMDLAKTDYMSLAADARVEPGGIAAVIVNINCSFYSPAYFDEPLSVATATVGISVHSFTLEQRVYNRQTGDVKCIARVVLAGFDPVAHVGIPLPADFSASLRAFEGME